MRRIYFSLAICLFLCHDILAQQDSSAFKKEMEEVVVTATRSERKLSNVAVPTTIISSKRIIQSGSLRLNDILGEQTGLFITESFGKGLQMQGLSPDYTLILLNGEPLIGRTGGVLDLSRIAVGNIKKIEIIKGPSSSLYGSEALAGVVNIITDQPAGERLSASLRYGRFNTLDGTINGSMKAGKFSGSAFVNSNSSEGYSLVPGSIQKTVEPYWRLANQVQAAYDFNNKTRLSASFRYATEDIQNSITVQNLGQTILSTGKETNKDMNFNPVLTHMFNKHWKTHLRGYVSTFGSDQKLDVKTTDINYNDRFRQAFYRIESQTEYTASENLIFNGGAGYIRENVSSSRYDSLSEKHYNNIAYAFIQNEWKPVKNLMVITGIRFDANQAYASVFSPKIALRYRITDKLSATGSVGKGFKAPDFRQLYLNFTNVAAGSYSVFGSLVAKDEISRLDAAGQIENITPVYDKLGPLNPETSTGINAGLHFDVPGKINAKLNVFRNDINNLIITDIIAYKTNGGQVYSYLNVNRAYTEGFELEAGGKLNPFFSLAGGYQFLITADKDVLDDIKAGLVFTRDAQNGISRKISRSEYAGLPNRSRHMANIKLFYESRDNKWFATTRAIWRSRWGTTDIDGNGIINREDEFANGYVTINLSGGRQFKNGIRIMAGVDNLLNYKDPENLPGQPGYQWYAGISYDFLQKHKQ
jgi:outer membrane receptor for ferrienterochelin and colicins